MKKIVIYTNLDTENMVKELETHLKNVKNKNYIKECIDMHLNKGFINKEELEYLYKEYNIE